MLIEKVYKIKHWQFEEISRGDASQTNKLLLNENISLWVAGGSLTCSLHISPLIISRKTTTLSDSKSDTKKIKLTKKNETVQSEKVMTSAIWSDLLIKNAICNVCTVESVGSLGDFACVVWLLELRQAGELMDLWEVLLIELSFSCCKDLDDFDSRKVCVIEISTILTVKKFVFLRFRRFWQTKSLFWQKVWSLKCFYQFLNTQNQFQTSFFDLNTKLSTNRLKNNVFRFKPTNFKLGRFLLKRI